MLASALWAQHGASGHGGGGQHGGFGVVHPGIAQSGVGLGHLPGLGHDFHFGTFGYGTFPNFAYPYYQFYGVPSYAPYSGIIYQPAYPAVQGPVIVQQGAADENRRDADTRLWLLALDGGLIRAASDYWVENNVLHYVLRDGTEGSVPLSELDLSLTEQLNRERGLTFRLPGPVPNK